LSALLSSLGRCALIDCSGRSAFLAATRLWSAVGKRTTPKGRLLHLFIVRLLYALEWGRALGPIIAFSRLIELFIPLHRAYGAW